MTAVSHELLWADYRSFVFRARCTCGWADTKSHMMEAAAKGAYNAHMPAPVQTTLPVSSGHGYYTHAGVWTPLEECTRDCLPHWYKWRDRTVADAPGAASRLRSWWRDDSALGGLAAILPVDAEDVFGAFVREETGMERVQADPVLVQQLRAAFQAGRRYQLAQTAGLVARSGADPAVPCCEVHGTPMRPDGHTYVCRACEVMSGISTA